MRELTGDGAAGPARDDEDGRITPALTPADPVAATLGNAAEDGSDETIRLDMLRGVLETYQSEHDRLMDRWKALDTKAQGTVAIAGIFLGGVFTFIRDLKPDVPAAEPWLLIGIALLLTTAVFTSVLALRVRGLIDPMPGEEAERIARDVVGRGTAEIRDLLPDIYGEQFGVWREVNQRLRRLIEHKARRLGLAQGVLLVAAVMMCILSLILVSNLG